MYVVFSVCCIQCMVYSVYGVFSVCCVVSCIAVSPSHHLACVLSRTPTHTHTHTTRTHSHTHTHTQRSSTQSVTAEMIPVSPTAGGNAGQHAGQHAVQLPPSAVQVKVSVQKKMYKELADLYLIQVCCTGGLLYRGGGCRGCVRHQCQVQLLHLITCINVILSVPSLKRAPMHTMHHTLVRHTHTHTHTHTPHPRRYTVISQAVLYGLCASAPMGHT